MKLKLPPKYERVQLIGLALIVLSTFLQFGNTLALAVAGFCALAWGILAERSE